MQLSESCGDIETIVKLVFDAVPGKHEEGQKDFRVAVAGMMYQNNTVTSYILNNKV